MTAPPEQEPVGIPDASWPLAEEFDRVARIPGEPPDPAFLYALEMWLSDEIVTVLLESHAELCIGEKRPEAENYAEHLTALADLLDPDDRRAVRAAVDVSAAELYMRTGNEAEALRRAQRCADDVEELMPGLRGDREYVLGCLAENAGRHADAQAHAARARDHFAADERWSEAAAAAEAAAGTPERITPEAVADWRRAAELHVVAGEPDEARECAEQLCFEIVKGWGGFREGDEPSVEQVCTGAATLAREHKLPVHAVRLDMLAVAMAADSGDPFDDVAARVERCGRALAEVDLTPDERRLDETRLRMFLGVSCVAHSRWAEAERLLAGVLPVLRTSGIADEVAMCEDALRGLLLATGGAGAAAGLPVDVRLLAEGLWLAQDGRLDEALRRLDEARAAAGTSSGDPHRVLIAEGAAAALRLVRGDERGARAVGDRIDSYLAAGNHVPRSRRIPLTALAGLLRCGAAWLDGRVAEQLAASEAVETQLLALGAGPAAAQLAVRRARALLDADRPRDSVNVGLPAALALDALRCTLPDADRRSRWARQAAAGLDTAFRAAAACGDTRVLAELLEVARGNAVPLPRAPNDRADAVSALADALGPTPAATATTAVRSGATAAAGGEERTVLGLPALVRTPWDTVALGSALDAARRYLDPVRAEVTVEWRVTEP